MQPCEDQIDPGVQNSDNYTDTMFGSLVTPHPWLSGLNTWTRVDYDF